MADGTTIGSNPTQAANVDFGGIMNQGLDRLAQNQERERIAQEREIKRNQEFEDRYGIDESLFQLEDTEFRTVNDTAIEAVSLYRDRYYDVYKQLKADPNNVDLKKRLGNISNSVKRLSDSNQKIKAIGDKYIIMLQDDKLSGVDEDRWRDQLEATEDGRVKVSMDDKDNMQYLFYNKDGKLDKVIPFKELINDDLIERVDLDSQLDSLVESIGTDTKDTVSGGFIKTTNTFGTDQERFVTEFIDSYLGTDERSLQTNPVLADLLNQATGGSSKKRSGFTQQERDFVKKYLIQQTKDRFDESTKLKQLSSRGGRGPSAAELKQPKPSDINIAFDGGQLQRDSDGRFMFTIGKDIAIDPTKSDRKIDTIKANADGTLAVEGEDRIKVKGTQEDTLESVAEKEGVEPSFLEKELGSDGKVQYYKRVPFSTDDMSKEQRAKTLNKLGNIFGVEDELGLRNILYQDMVQKFGKETADKIINVSKQESKEAVKENTNTKDPLGLGI
ncbi:hypothetical protein PANI_CDS0071 [Maribacter phage Panino]